MISHLKSLLAHNTGLLYVASAIYNFLHCSTAWRHRRSNTIVTRGSFLRGVKFHISGRDNQITIEPKARLRRCTMTIIGDNCHITIGTQSIIINAHLWCQDDRSTITLGKKLTMEGGHIAATEGGSIIVGEDCMFSSAIEIRNGDSHSILDTISGERINAAQNVVIGNHVWLCAKATLLKGSHIPHNSIVGNSSIVGSQFETPNAIYSGIPARQIKKDIDWARQRL